MRKKKKDTTFFWKEGEEEGGREKRRKGDSSAEGDVTGDEKVTARLRTQGRAGHGICHPQRHVSIFFPMASGGAVDPVLQLKKWLEPELLAKPTRSLGATSLYHLFFPQEHENLCSIFINSQQSLFKANS